MSSSDPQQQVDVGPQNPTLAQPSEASNPIENRTTRTRKPPAHLTDYICYNANRKDPFLIAHRFQDDSSGMPYPIINYVTSTNFSIAHQNFIAAITKVPEPTYYHEAVTDSRWRAAMDEEIRALEKNETWTWRNCHQERNPLVVSGSTESSTTQTVLSNSSRHV